MRSVIVYTSVHHETPRRSPGRWASALGAEAVRAADATPETVASADLVGFGSGIYFGSHHKTLLAFAASLPMEREGRAFIFSTSGRGGNRLPPEAQRHLLVAKGYTIVGEFACKGWDSYSLLKLIGGINKGRPDGERPRGRGRLRPRARRGLERAVLLERPSEPERELGLASSAPR